MEDAISEEVIESTDSIPTDESGESENTETVAATTQMPQRETTINVDGRDYNVTQKILMEYYQIPPNEELTDKEYKTLLSSYKQAIHSNNMNRAASNKQKEIDNFVKAFDANPKETLKLMFQSNSKALQDLAEEILMEKLEHEMLDPKEKEIKHIREENEKLKREFEEKQRLAKEQEEEYLLNQYSNQYENELMAAFDKYGLAKEEETVLLLANLKANALRKGQDISFDKLAEQYIDYVNRLSKQSLASLPPDKLIEYLGDAKMKEIRKYDIDKIRNIPTATSNSPNGKSNALPKDKNKMSMEEFREFARKRASQLR